MKNSTNQSTHTNAVFESTINNYLNRYLGRNAINEEFIEAARSDLFESFSGEIFADEHRDAWIKITGSTKHWSVFKDKGDAEYHGRYADFAGSLVGNYISKTLFNNALYDASSQIKNPALQSAINKISSELSESFIWNMTENMFIEEEFAKTLLNHVESKLSAEYNNIRPELEALPFPAELKDLTYEYYSGDVINDLSQELSGESSEDA